MVKDMEECRQSEVSTGVTPSYSCLTLAKLNYLSLVSYVHILSF